MSWTLTMGGIIRGRILPGETPLPRYYEILLFDAADTSTAICGASPINPSDSSFRFLGLDDGAYFIKFSSAYSTPSSWFPGVAGAAQAETLRVRNLIGPEEVVWPWK